MNITLRSSGGRGEYELAGRHGDIRIADLFGMPLYLEILPNQIINTHSKCLHKDGKPRIRLDSSHVKDAHPSALVIYAALLPKPRRKLDDTIGENLIQRENFVVQTIRVDAVIKNGRAILSPVIVQLENASGAKHNIIFAERMARVLRVWTAAGVETGGIAEAVQKHARAFCSPMSSQIEQRESYTELWRTLNEPAGDLLPILERHFAMGSVGRDYSEELSDEDLKEEVHLDPTEARVERVKQWRLAASRGSSATLFRTKVQNAYDFRCLFTGHRLPKIETTTRAGVDAAHILPWSNYNLDITQNGLCLSKQCHWAFDEGLLRLSYDESINAYVLTISKESRVAAEKVGFEMSVFDALVGPIPKTRLPASHTLWPSHQYLKDLNGFLDGKMI